MDPAMRQHPGDSVVVTGLGCEVPPAVSPWLAADPSAATPPDALLCHDADPLPFLRVRKTAKFLSKQDRLALSAAAAAVRSASLTADLLAERTMIAMGVGPIPFQRDEAMAVARQSGDHGEFSMQCFCREAYEQINPMLLFACLPNMPAYHISANLQIRGGYCLTYPSCAESYHAFQNAVCALAENRADAVLFGGVADQQNFLVENHHRKTGQRLPAPDCACFLVLETASAAAARGITPLARLVDLHCRRTAQHVTEPRDFFFGPAELPIAVARFAGQPAIRQTHIWTEDGQQLESTWEK
jgi:3-oxoacyl-(acyl-carrier-protein) synthase